MDNRKFKKAFTLPELLTAVGIIALLISILLPALNMARNFSKNAKQKVIISSLEVGINMRKNDQGEYPPSRGKNDTANATYCGAETLAEAMFGCDLMGYHPKSEYLMSANYNGTTVYDAADASGANLRARKGLYIDKTNVGVFQVRDVYNAALATDYEYVICDVFDAWNKKIHTDNTATVTTNKYKIGTPILYFRADTSQLEIASGTPAASIYNYNDNVNIVTFGKATNVSGGANNLYHTEFTINKFYGSGAGSEDGYIRDKTVRAGSRVRPMRPDSFLLISAGLDGLYGTTDDVCNFEQNVQ